MRGPLALLVAFALPVLAADGFTTLVKDALGSAEPTTAVLRGLAKLPDQDLSGDEVARALAEAGATPDGQVAKVLGDVTRVSKTGDRITIERRAARTVPIAVKGQTKGWVRLGEKVTLRLHGGDALVLDEVTGVSVGKTEKDLYTVHEIDWKPGEKAGVLALKVPVGPFTHTEEISIPNDSPAEAAPSATSGFMGRMR